jgi:D-alanyl-D-alanine carboxypeptidase
MTLAIAFNAAAAGPILAQTTVHAEKSSRYASIAVEETTGKILYERNADRALYPASTTKLMTAYLVFDALKEGTLTLDQELTVSAKAAGQPATNLAMMRDVPIRRTVTGKDGKKRTITVRTERQQVVKKITVEHALRGMLVHSANDAAVVFAEKIGGSTQGFATLMNAEAKRLGMTGTTYVNPNGLPDTRQKTTVQDMAKLATALIEDFPEYYRFFNVRSFTFNGRTYTNTNRMLRTYPGMDGMKTGWISASGFNLVASAVKDDKRVVAIVFGAAQADERNEDMRRLLDYAFLKLTSPKVKFTYGPAPTVANRQLGLPPRREIPPPQPETVAAPEIPAPPPPVADTLSHPSFRYQRRPIIPPV